jgi:hypothetical protein
VESISGQIPIVSNIVKRANRIYKRKEIAPILNYLSQAQLPRCAIAKVHHGTGTPYSTLRDWHDM